MRDILKHLRISLRWSRINPRRSGRAGAAFLIAGAIVLSLRSAGFEPSSGAATPQPGGAVKSEQPPDRTRDLGEFSDRLTAICNEVVRLGSLINKDRDVAQKMQNAFLNQRIKVASTEANYENAKLAREIAEIGVAEYEEGIYKQDLATLEGELVLARSDLMRARDTVEILKDRLAQVKKASTHTEPEREYERGFEVKITESIARIPKVQQDLAAAESRLLILRQFTKTKRTSELKAEVERRRADELDRQAALVEAQATLERLKNAQSPAPDKHRDRELDLLGQSITLATDLKTALDQIEKSGEWGEATKAQMDQSLDRLHALVSDAQSEHAASTWARTKARLQELAREQSKIKN